MFKLNHFLQKKKHLKLFIEKNKKKKYYFVKNKKKWNFSRNLFKYCYQISNKKKLNNKYLFFRKKKILLNLFLLKKFIFINYSKQIIWSNHFVKIKYLESLYSQLGTFIESYGRLAKYNKKYSHTLTEICKKPKFQSINHKTIKLNIKKVSVQILKLFKYKQVDLFTCTKNELKRCFIKGLKKYYKTFILLLQYNIFFYDYRKKYQKLFYIILKNKKKNFFFLKQNKSLIFLMIRSSKINFVNFRNKSLDKLVKMYYKYLKVKLFIAIQTNLKKKQKKKKFINIYIKNKNKIVNLLQFKHIKKLSLLFVKEQKVTFIETLLMYKNKIIKHLALCNYIKNFNQLNNKLFLSQLKVNNLNLLQKHYTRLYSTNNFKYVLHNPVKYTIYNLKLNFTKHIKKYNIKVFNILKKTHKIPNNSVYWLKKKILTNLTRTNINKLEFLYKKNISKLKTVFFVKKQKKIWNYKSIFYCLKRKKWNKTVRVNNFWRLRKFKKIKLKYWYYTKHIFNQKTNYKLNLNFQIPKTLSTVLILKFYNAVYKLKKINLNLLKRRKKNKKLFWKKKKGLFTFNFFNMKNKIKKLKQVKIFIFKKKIHLISLSNLKISKPKYIKKIHNYLLLNKYTKLRSIISFYKKSKNLKKPKKLKNNYKKKYYNKKKYSNKKNIFFFNLWQGKLRSWKIARHTHWYTYLTKTIKTRRYKLFLPPYLRLKSIKIFQLKELIFGYFAIKFNFSYIFWKNFSDLYLLLFFKKLQIKTIYQFPISLNFWTKIRDLKRRQNFLNKRIYRWIYKKKKIKKTFWMKKKKKLPKFFFNQSFKVKHNYNNIQYDFLTNYFSILKFKYNFSMLNNIIYTNKLLKIHNYRYKA